MFLLVSLLAYYIIVLTIILSSKYYNNMFQAITTPTRFLIDGFSSGYTDLCWSSQKYSLVNRNLYIILLWTRTSPST